MKNSMAIEKRPQKDRTIKSSTVLMMDPGTLDNWSYRVPVSKNQAIIGFPKFMTIGIGFEKEVDWNTNLPYSSDAESILAHIWHNRGSDGSKRFREKCLTAIRMIQEQATKDRRR
jgi:hypothetical protein